MATIISTESPLGCYNSNGLSEFQTSGDGVSVKGSTVTIDISNVPAGQEQQGRATVFVGPGYKTLKIDAVGRIETRNPGYDWISVRVEGKLVLYRESTQETAPICDYETDTASVTISLPGCQGCGTIVFIEAAPNDEICNDGVNWSVTLTPQEN